MAQSVKRPTLNLSSGVDLTSGLDLTVMSSSLALSSMVGVEPTLKKKKVFHPLSTEFKYFLYYILISHMVQFWNLNFLPLF